MIKILDDPSTGCTNDPPGPRIPEILNVHHIAIFPPLGISRVGDSDECFLAPEVPGHKSPPKGPDGKEYMFRDAKQKLRRQAVRFRVYAYDYKNTIIAELNANNNYTLTWTVNVANKKAAGRVFQRNGRFGPPNTSLRNPSVQPNNDLDQRDRLIIKAEGQISSDSSPGFVPLRGTFQGSKPLEKDPVGVDLAGLQLDEAGRLVFIPGQGDACSITNLRKRHPQVTSQFDNEDWFDEICDGTVTVKVTGLNLPTDVPVVGARVLSAPPKFAWGINMPTNLYDIMENMYHKESDPVQVDFWKHIWPVLRSAASISWTNNMALQGHGQFSTGHFDAQALLDLFRGSGTFEEKEKRKLFKTRIFKKLRQPLNDKNPDHTQADVRYMPLLSGDTGDLPGPGEYPPNLTPDARRFASLTSLQYRRFEAWKDDDNFHLTDTSPPTPKSKLEDLPITDQPDQLTRAILEPTVGDPCFPGIEVFGIVKLKETYDTEVAAGIEPPFRIHESVLPGHLTRGLSLPWQCDFDMCNTHWWPAVRPDDVITKLQFENTVQNSTEKEDFDTAITTRVQWKRGLRETVSRSNWIGSEDMIKYWKYLGVVREVRGKLGDDDAQIDYTAFLEDERVAL